ncbi:MAG TPA: hypothetical protein VNF91_06305 [Candidatus Acidoferrum sp.]|nr:hypothetical protein [Candidatus Acidoferrum sp.]
MRAFWLDLEKALRAWGAAPALPIVSAVLGLLTELSSIAEPGLHAAAPGVPWFALLTFISWPFLLFWTGWLGTQRLWYLRIFRGQKLSAPEAWRLSRHYLGRFLVLGLIVGLPISALIFAVIVREAQTAADTGAVTPSQLPGWTTGVFLAYWFAMDVLLTFVTPALAYTTRHVREAIAIGWSMLRTTWPRCAVYALLPPLTLVAFATYNPSAVSPLGLFVISVMSTLLGLVTKGAIASFYIDHGPGVIDPMTQ